MKLHFYRMELDDQSLPVMVREEAAYCVDGRCKYHNPEKVFDLAKSIRLPERAEEYLYMVSYSAQTLSYYGITDLSMELETFSSEDVVDLSETSAAE